MSGGDSEVGAARVAAAERVRERLGGVMVTPVTPFLKDFSIDWDGLDETIDFLIGSGVAAVVPCGSMGEFPLLSVDEREELVARTAQRVAGRALVLAGTSDEDPSVAIRLTRSAMQAGADAAMVKPPHYYGLSDEEVRAFYSDIDAVGLPFIAYDNPGASRRRLSLDDLEVLTQLPQFAGLKEATSDIVAFYRVIWRFGARFPVIAGDEDTVFFALLAGAAGAMTATAAFAPAFMHSMLDAVRCGDVPQARALQERLWHFRELLRVPAATGHPAYLTYTKAALELLGLPAGPPRPPLQPLGAAERAVLATALRDGMRIGPRGALLDEVPV